MTHLGGTSRRFRGIGAAVLVLVVTMGGGVGIEAASAQERLTPAQASLRGTLSVLHGDGIPGSGLGHRHVYFLRDDTGRQYELKLPDHVQEGLGRFDGKRVVVRGAVRSAAAGSPTVDASSVEGDEPPVETKPLAGEQRFVTILCRFGDSLDVTPTTVEHVNELMGESPFGMSHYWRENSFNAINTAESIAAGWYNLPQPRGAYFSDDGRFNTRAAAYDCTGAADPYVDFRGLAGINLFFNEALDGYAWGGRSPGLELDGPWKQWPMTWLPPWGYQNQGIVAHEMGHAFGLPHSSGSYGEVYDSGWDVMSAASGSWDPVYGRTGTHTIAHHKDRLGWVPASRVYEAPPNTCRVIQIDHLSQVPATSGSYLMARIRTTDPVLDPFVPPRFYTVEARKRTGYDRGIPGEAIVIHDVDTARNRPAHVVDETVDGNPNDEGAQWLPGETFNDAARKVKVEVLTPAVVEALRLPPAQANGWWARITRGDATCQTGIGTGLQGEYFDNADLTGLRMTRTDATVNFDWGSGSPATTMGPDTFSVRWTGEVQAQYTENHTFHVSTDDGVRLWVNDRLVVDKWVDQGATEWSGTVLLTAGTKYPIRMEYYENGGGATARLSWSSPSLPKQVVSTSQLYPPEAGGGTGLRGDYFDNADLTALRVTRTDERVNFDWASASPDPTIGADTFSVRWTGAVEARYSEPYTFHVNTDDGVRLWVNDQLLVDKWVNQGATEWSGTVALTAGTRYPITIEYYDNAGRASARVLWSSPSTDKQVIPKARLYQTGLKGEYFDNVDLTALKVVRNEGPVNFDWGWDSPHPAIGPDTFSVRWTGEVVAEHSETYTFHVNTDDGVRLWVNGQLLVDKWVNQGATEWSGSIALTAGRKYAIRMEYYDRWGGAVAQLRWSSPSTAKQLIPSRQLTPAA